MDTIEQKIDSGFYAGHDLPFPVKHEDPEAYEATHKAREARMEAFKSDVLKDSGVEGPKAERLYQLVREDWRDYGLQCCLSQFRLYAEVLK